MIDKITLDSILELTPANGYLPQAIDGLGFEAKYSVNELLSRHGAKLGNVTYSQKRLTLTFLVVGSTLTEMLDRRNTLIQYLSADPYEEDDTHKWSFTLADGKRLYIDAVTKSLQTGAVARDTFATTIRVTLESFYPFFLSEQQYQVSMNVTQGGGLAVPLEVPADMTAGSSGYKLVTNGGNIFAYPTIKFIGTLTNPVLTDVDTGKVLQFPTLSLADDTEYVIVDTFNRTVVDQDGNNVLDEMSGDFLVIKAGQNNFSLVTDTSTEDGQVIFTYNYAYGSF